MLLTDAIPPVAKITVGGKSISFPPATMRDWSALTAKFREEPRDRPQQGGFARAIGAAQLQVLADAEPQIDLFEDRALATQNTQIAHFQQHIKHPDIVVGMPRIGRFFSSRSTHAVNC